MWFNFAWIRPSHRYSLIGISCATLTSNNGAFDKDYYQRGCGQKKAQFPFTRRPMNKLPAVNYTAECRSFAASTGPPISTTVSLHHRMCCLRCRQALFSSTHALVCDQFDTGLRYVCWCALSHAACLFTTGSTDAPRALAASLGIGRESLLLRTPY